MKQLVIFLKIIFVTSLSSILMYLLLIMDGTVKNDFSVFFKEFFPMLSFAVFLATWYNKSRKDK